MCLSKRKLCPPSEDCAPKKLTGSGLLECKSRPKTPKLVFSALQFVSKNCFFVIFVNLHRISCNFWDENLFFWSLLQNSRKIATLLRRQPELVKFWDEDLFFFSLHLFRLIHARINFSCPRALLEFT